MPEPTNPIDLPPPKPAAPSIHRGPVTLTPRDIVIRLRERGRVAVLKGSVSKASVSKLRGGPTGAIRPFRLRAVPIDNRGNTSCCVEWLAPAEHKPAEASKKAAWTGNARLLKTAIERALLDFGVSKRPFVDRGEVKAVLMAKVRSEFYASYPSDGPDAKKKAFRRLVDAANAQQLIGTHEIDGSDYLWLSQGDNRSAGQRDI